MKLRIPLLATGAPLPYGSFELKKLYPRHLRIALILAIAIHLLVVGLFALGGYLSQKQEKKVVVRVLKYTDLGPPPSVRGTELPPAPVATPVVAQPKVGVPVPVPEAEVPDPEQTIATQEEMASAAITPIDTIGGGTEIVIEDDILPEFGTFVPYETPPTIIYKVEPKYPEIARKAGVEGTVILQVLIDKEGKIRDIMVVKSLGNTGCDEAAIEAVKQWKFSPAKQRDTPVAVWLAIPFTFILKQ